MTEYEQFFNTQRGEILSISIVEGTTKIKNCAFSHFSSLTSITIPPSVTAIGKEAFSGCSTLTAITIPPSVRTMEGNPFENWHGHIDINSPYFKYEDGALIDVEKGILVAFRSNAESCTIPPSVTAVGDKAFSGCKSLTSNTIPPSDTAIGDYAFKRCKYIPNNTNQKRETDKCRKQRHKCVHTLIVAFIWSFAPPS